MAPYIAATTRAIILTVVLWTAALAYPKYWWDPSQGVMPDGNACDAHPERAYPELELDGFWIENPHGVPRPDPGISFTFRNAASAVVTSLCPGANYTLQGSFPLPSLVLLSASVGRFLSPAATPDCPNRVDWGGSVSPRAASLFNATFSVPCNASGGIRFRATSASRGYPGTWTYAATTLTVNPDCAAAKCAVGSSPKGSPLPPLPSPPKPKRRPPPPRKSPSPSRKPSPPPPSPKPLPKPPSPRKKPFPPP